MNGDPVENADTLFPRQWQKVQELTTVNKWGFGPFKRPLSFFHGWKLSDFDMEINNQTRRLAYWMGRIPAENSDGFSEVRVLWCQKFLDQLRDLRDQTEIGQSPARGELEGAPFPRRRILPMPTLPFGAHPAFITKREREESENGDGVTVQVEKSASEPFPIALPPPSEAVMRPFKPPRKKRRVGENEMRWLAEVNVDLPCKEKIESDEEEDELLQNQEHVGDSEEE